MGGLGAYLASTTIALVAVCALAVLSLRLLGRRRPERGAMRVIERLPLEARRTLYLVEVGGRCFLVGAGEGGMASLAELDPGQVKAPAAAETRGAFLRALTRVVAGGGREAG